MGLAMKYLELYYQWIETGRLPNAGLCNSLHFKYETTGMLNEMFRPVGASYWTPWAGTSKNSIDNCYAFNPLRQNIMLLMAAMNGEL